MKELKDLIRARRSEIGKTFEEIGKEVGVSKATVLRWESGEIKDMRRDKLVALAKALKTTPSYLMGWEDETGAEKTAAEDGDGLSPLEKRLMQLVHRLSDDQKEMLLAQIELLLSKQG